MSNKLKELLAAIPSRDESLCRALADIEQKLNAWSAALDGFHYATPPASAPSIESHDVAKSASTITPNPSVEEPATQPVAEVKPATIPKPNKPAPSDLHDGVVEPNTEPEYELSDGEPGETPVARPSNPDDDESVLVGLSPESAKAIKVQWRLLEGTKSLRQLVEEHKARLVRGDGKGDGKRSWWARGKG